MTQRLFIDTLTSIGAVEDGDNPQAKIMLFKRRESGKARLTTTNGLHSDTIPDRERLSKDVTRMDITKLGLPAEAEAAVTAELAKLHEQIAALTPKAPGDVLKGAAPEIKDLVAKQQADIAALQKQADEQAKALEKEQDDRRTVEVAKIVDQYDTVIGDNDNAVAMLKAVPAETLGWLTERFAHMEKIATDSGLFKETGSGAGDDDPAGQIQTMAVEKMAQNTELTLAQARTLARTERPDLAVAERTGS